MMRIPRNGRYELSGSPVEVAHARFGLWKITRFWHAKVSQGFSPKDEFWLSGIDRQTGERVLVHPRGDVYTWKHDLATEAAARRVQALALPQTVPILHVGPGIVFAMPPPVQPRPSLSIEAAAACAREVCEAAARLHERGCGRLSFGLSQLRLVEENGEWRPRWIVPGVDDLDLLEELEVADDLDVVLQLPRWSDPLDPIPRDLWHLVSFFFSLLAADTKTESALDPARREALLALSRIREEGPQAADVHDAATLDRILARLTNAPERAAPLPVVRTLPRMFLDWDEVITDGEISLVETERDRSPSWAGYIKLPLAAAYHQRASRSWARGEIEGALKDVDRAVALDGHAPYHTTRAVLLDTLGRRAEARAALAAAFEAHAHPTYRRWVPESEEATEEETRTKEKARAHLTRGMVSLREGSFEEAEADLRQAAALHETPLTTRALTALARAHVRKTS